MLGRFIASLFRAENEKLRRENAELRREIAALRAQQSVNPKVIDYMVNAGCCAPPPTFVVFPPFPEKK